jgi:hypothetical protein
MQRNFGALFGPARAALASSPRHFVAIERNIGRRSPTGTVQELRRTPPRACFHLPDLKNSKNPHSHSGIAEQMSIFMQ